MRRFYQLGRCWPDGVRTDAFGRDLPLSPIPARAKGARGLYFIGCFVSIVLLPALAHAAPLVYATPCPTTLSIAIRVTPQGFAITIDRPGDRDPGPFTTRDVNFAQVSRRLFFKARTAEGLIEFQGHARGDALSGLFSDDRGGRRAIILPVATDMPRCDLRPGEAR